jgi:FkbM family methyltransferase
LFVDWGGHNGSSVRKFRRDFDPKQRFDIVSFEPNPAYADAFTGFTRHTLIPAAVWIANDSLDFYLNREDGDGSTLFRHKLTRHEGWYGELDRHSPIKVAAIDLSAWLRTHCRPGDYVILKLDVEGAEYPLLRKMIRDGTIDLIDELLIEWHWDRVRISHEEHASLVDQLTARRISVSPWDAQRPSG